MKIFYSARRITFSLMLFAFIFGAVFCLINLINDGGIKNLIGLLVTGGASVAMVFGLNDMWENEK